MKNILQRHIRSYLALGIIYLYFQFDMYSITKLFNNLPILKSNSSIRLKKFQLSFELLDVPVVKYLHPTLSLHSLFNYELFNFVFI